MLTITVLAENSDGKGLCGEHGLALHIEYEGRRYLLDAGLPAFSQRMLRNWAFR